MNIGSLKDDWRVDPQPLVDGLSAIGKYLTGRGPKPKRGKAGRQLRLAEQIMKARKKKRR